MNKKVLVIACIGVAVVVAICYGLFAGESASKILSSRIGQDVAVDYGNPPTYIGGKLADVDDSGILVKSNKPDGAYYIPMRSIISVGMNK